MPSENNPDTARITIRKFLELAAGPLCLQMLAGQGSLDFRFLDSPRVQKLGLALSGFAKNVHTGRIQIFGNSERNFVERLSETEIAASFDRLAGQPITCILMTAGTVPPGQMLKYAESSSTPILATDLPSSEVISGITEILGNALAPVVTLHGVMVEIYGIGVLIRGESGIGKSECALELIGRGHRLISDDMVTLKQVGDSVFGEPPEAIKDQLEIRGLGILNARELFGVSALSPSARVQLCIELIPLSESHSLERLGVDSDAFGVLGTEIVKYCIPVSPGRNLATLAEAAVRVFVSRRIADESLNELIGRHDRVLAANTD